MFVSLKNGVVLSVCKFTENGKIKTIQQAKSEASKRIKMIGVAGNLVNDKYQKIAEFNYIGELINR